MKKVLAFLTTAAVAVTVMAAPAWAGTTPIDVGDTVGPSISAIISGIFSAVSDVLPLVIPAVLAMGVLAGVIRWLRRGSKLTGA